MNGGIRVRYTGLILFAGNLLSFLTGFIFSVLIARNLLMEDMGAWFFIGSMIGYFEVMERALPYWATRDAARGMRVARTTIYVNFLVSLPAAILFLALSPFFASLIDTSVEVFAVSALFIPLYYVSVAELSIIRARAPHLAGPRSIIIDGVKILLALLLLPYGLLGVILAVLFANAVFITYGWIVIRGEFEERMNLGWAYRRLKQAWLPLQHLIAAYVKKAADITIIGVLTSATTLSSYGIALIISNTLSATRGLTSAIYPKLLESRGRIGFRELASVFKFHYMFTIPMLVGGFILAPNLITFFGSKYLDGLSSFYLLLPSSFIGTLIFLLRNLVQGVESVDEDLEAGFKMLVKSKLFASEAATYFSTASIILVSIMTVPYLGSLGAAIARMISNIILFILLLLLYLRVFSIRPLLFGMFKPLVSSIPMAVFLLYFSPVGSIQTLFFIGLGAMIYFVSLYFLDEEARVLWRAAVREVMSKLHLFEEG